MKTIIHQGVEWSDIRFNIRRHEDFQHLPNVGDQVSYDCWPRGSVRSVSYHSIGKERVANLTDDLSKFIGGDRRQETVEQVNVFHVAEWSVHIYLENVFSDQNLQDASSRQKKELIIALSQADDVYVSASNEELAKYKEIWPLLDVSSKIQNYFNPTIIDVADLHISGPCSKAQIAVEAFLKATGLSAITFNEHEEVIEVSIKDFSKRVFLHNLKNQKTLSRFHIEAELSLHGELQKIPHDTINVSYFYSDSISFYEKDSIIFWGFIHKTPDSREGPYWRGSLLPIQKLSSLAL